jgi:uncharacterized short protein YbdD (DUF466 family)
MAFVKVMAVWQTIRQLSGDDAYERYLQHYAKHHQHEEHCQPPLSKLAFYKQWQDAKWEGVKRCC